jgi:hypothetical protein
MPPVLNSKNKDSAKNNNFKELSFNDDYYNIDKSRIQLGKIKKEKA